MRISKNQSQKDKSDDGQGRNANNDSGNHHLVISGNGH